MAKNKPNKIVHVEVHIPRTGAAPDIGRKSRKAGAMDMRPKWTRSRRGRENHEIAISREGGE